MKRLLAILILSFLLTGCYTLEPTADLNNSTTITGINVTSPASWADYINNGLKTAKYYGEQEWEAVEFSNFDAAAEYDIDGDGEKELVLRYCFLASDYADMDTIDYTYIILKINNGNIVKIADFWNQGGLRTNTLRFDGTEIVVVTMSYAMVAKRYKVSILSNGKYVKQFSWTEYDDAENGYMILFTQENSVKYASIGVEEKEKYLGNNLSTSDLSINSSEELISRINEINSYPEVYFSKYFDNNLSSRLHSVK
jgi:hypothetical protein